MGIRNKISTALVATLAVASFEAHPMATYYGFDEGADALTRAPSVISDAARGFFLSLLPNAGTEDFEGFATGLSAPLNVSFPGNGTAVVSGGAGVIIDSQPAGATDGFGRYPNSGTQYVMVGTGSLTVTFGSRMAAFGFTAIDIGDFGADLRLIVNLADGGSQVLNVGATPFVDGSRLFFGLIAQGTGEEFTSVVLQGTGTDIDVFAFDDMSVSAAPQACATNCTVPEPGVLPLLALGLIGLAARRRRVA